MALDKINFKKKSVLISHENVRKGEELAKLDNRSFSNLVNTLVAKHYRETMK